MSSGNRSLKDKEIFLLNHVTGEINIALKFNSDRIVTTDLNLLDRENLIFDAVSQKHVSMGNMIITDDDGNVILADDIADIPSRN
jgi:hypothetical protein